MVNEKRLKRTFEALVQIDSESRHEGRVAAEIREMLSKLGGKCEFDDAGEKLGGDSGNLLVRFSGNKDAPPIFLNAHMDTVVPGKGVTVQFENGVFRSDGTTVLGGDDKSGIAALIEAMRVLTENDLPMGPVELLFTVCEEVGILGAKCFDIRRLSARFGYALDTSNTGVIVTRAPGQNQLRFKIKGKSAHAGQSPEKGINAIEIASRAVAGLKTGRLDAETTSNIGVIKGGKATNIVPDEVVVEGEVRGHHPERLSMETDNIVAAFGAAVKNYPNRDPEAGLPELETTVKTTFERTRIPEDHPLVLLAKRAAENIGLPMKTIIGGGGSDANIFFAGGLMTGVLGTGMRDVHTVNESIALKDMADTTRLIIEILRIQGKMKREYYEF